MASPVQPSLQKGAFSCPHCGAYTTQHWHKLRSQELKNGDFPARYSATLHDAVSGDRELDDEAKKPFLEWLKNLKSGFVFFEREGGEYFETKVYNLNLSSCYHCHKVAVWVGERVVFPDSKVAISPNADLPHDILKDFEEASAIANQSPRGAAALLRLCIQKLCIHLGEKGKKIDDDIGSMVKKGLNPLVQQALDIVRVIGNEAVHPGSIDLNDDRETALQLFELVNAIVDQMITHPKAVKELYAKLPESKRKAIEARDKS